MAGLVRVVAHPHFRRVALVCAGEAARALEEAGFESAAAHSPAELVDRLEIDAHAARGLRVIEATVS